MKPLLLFSSLLIYYLHAYAQKSRGIDGVFNKVSKVNVDLIAPCLLNGFERKVSIQRNNHVIGYNHFKTNVNDTLSGKYNRNQDSNQKTYSVLVQNEFEKSRNIHLKHRKQHA